MFYYINFIFPFLQLLFQNSISSIINESSIINYDCLSGPSGVCRLLNVTHKNSNETLSFTTAVPEKVFMIEISRSSISILTSIFCQSFPGTEIFKLRSASLQKVDHEALILCRNLSSFDVIGNQLRFLNEDTFHVNTHLEYLFLSTNNFRCIHVNLFRGLSVLKELYLSYNKLRYLSPKTFEGLSELRLLSLHSNQLLEFDTLDIVSRLLKINTIHVKYNEFRCSILMEIMQVLDEKNIKYDKTLTKDDCEPDEEYEMRNTCIVDLRKGFLFNIPTMVSSSMINDIYKVILLNVIFLIIPSFC